MEVYELGKQKQAPKRSNRILWVAGGAVVLVAVVIGVSLATSRAPEPPPSAAVPAGERKAMGPTTAPVTLVEYGDFL